MGAKVPPPMRLFGGVALVGASRFGLSNPYDCSVYAIETSAGVVLIDAGSGLEPELIDANLRADGYDPGAVRALVLTHAHADHAGGARWWKARTGCEVLAPGGERGIVEGIVDATDVLNRAKRAGLYPADYVFPTVSVDRGVSDDDLLAFGDVTLRAIEVAGHSAHHTCYFAELAGRRVLFSGDAVFYGGSLLLQNIAECRMDDYRRDLPKLEGLRVDVLLPGHGIFVLRFGQEHINRAIEAIRGLAMPANFAALCPKVIPEAYRR